MFDLFSLGLLGLATISLVAAESLIFADTVRTEVRISSGLQESGYQQAIVTDYFDHELRRIFDAESIMVVPRIRVASTPSVVSVIANSIGVQGLRQSVQDMMGLNPVVIKLAVQPGPESRPLVHIFGRLSETDVFDFTVNSVPGNFRETIRTAAFEAAIALDPYQTLLDHAREVLQSRAISVTTLQRERNTNRLLAYREHNEVRAHELEALIARTLGIFEVATTRNRLRSIPLLNLAGVLNFNLEKFDEAERFFQLAYEANHSLVTPRLNIATIRLLRGHPDQAKEILRDVRADFAKGIGNPKARSLLEMTEFLLQAFMWKLENNESLASQNWRSLCESNPRPGFVRFYSMPKWAPNVPIAECERLLVRMRRAVEDNDEEPMFGVDGDIAAEIVILSSLFRSQF